MSRWRACGIHLLISVAVAVATVTVMLAAWYPGPLFIAAGGNELLFIITGVDVVIGPLLTLAVFKAGKRGMKLDLAVIGILQFCALVYGAYVVSAARPAFIVFVKDRFEVPAVVDLDPADLAKARYPQFSRVPLTGPEYVVLDFPTDPAERTQVLMLELSGVEVFRFPKYYEPYEKRRQEVIDKSWSIPRLREMEPAYARIVDEYLKSAGIAESGVRYVPLKAFRAWVAVLIDPRTGYPVKMLIVDSI
jgi:hypothetical protein